MRCEELVAPVAPEAPCRHRIGRAAHLRVQLEDAALPVEKVEFVQSREPVVSPA